MKRRKVKKGKAHFDGLLEILKSSQNGRGLRLINIRKHPYKSSQYRRNK